ncbi:MAG TPA: putative peptide maturation dehydrogenase [Kofleriaceae bacterium]|jgi:putative peptide maturation dehydrogenase|nr:putative peptide maturation dehydrogenase [Kofleriaceae bacterium]
MQVRRPSFLTIYFRSLEEGDLAALLRGEVRITRRFDPVAITLLDREEHPLTANEMAALARLPEDWVELSEVAAADRPEIAGLAARGVLLTRPGSLAPATAAGSDDETSDDGADARRRRDHELAATAWNRHAAVYHYTSRWHGQYRPLPPSLDQVWNDPSPRLDSLVSVHGSPAPAFRERTPAAPYIDLPTPTPDGPLFDLLRERRVTRLYERDADLPIDELNLTLHTVWGAHGYRRLSADLVVLRKTSPSAGALHPIEVYPVVRRVAGLEPGLYHYDVAGHGLELLRAMPHDDVSALAERLVAGQSYFATAQVILIMTARFSRTFWKYREHSKAYRAVLFDAAHLSQTLFLTAAQLDRGAFITVAFNEVDIDDALGLDPYREGAIAVCGFGIKTLTGDGLALNPAPYQPGRARP